MVPRLRGFGRRLGAVGRGFVNTFLRDNRVLPPVLALLALFVFAWIVAGAYIDEPEQGRVSNQTNVAQTQNAPGSDPVAPEVENRDVDSYAAYRNKDPFRELLPPAEGQESEQPPGAPADETTASVEPTAPDGEGAPSNGGGRPGGGRAADTDGDGLPDRRETALGQDPNNPDTDGDGTPDGADDADGDGRPDGGRRGAAGGTGGSAGDGAGGGAGGGGGAGTGGGATGSAPAAGGNGAGLGGEGAAGGGRGDGGRGAGGRDDGGGRPGRDDLLDSGGNLYSPYSAR